MFFGSVERVTTMAQNRPVRQATVWQAMFLIERTTTMTILTSVIMYYLWFMPQAYVYVSYVDVI